MKQKNNLLNIIKRPFIAAVRALLRCAPLRHRLVFEVQQKYYRELGVVVPLGDGIHCPVVSMEHWVSYQNLFCEKEYDSLLALIPPPCRWLDLGCHAGHFTLLMLRLHARAGTGLKTSALLLDPDLRVGPAIEALHEANALETERFPFLQGAIGPGSEPLALSEGCYMTSQIVAENTAHTRLVPCIGQDAILKSLPPPYDLVKLDVEGGEYDFLHHYPNVLSQTRHLLFEWHSWHPGGGGRDQLVERAQAIGFDFVAETYSGRAVPNGAETGSTGVILMKNRSLK